MDLGNSLGITKDGRPEKSIGNLALAYTDNKENDAIECPNKQNLFGHISFSDLKKYTFTSGIFKINVGEKDLIDARVIFVQVRIYCFSFLSILLFSSITLL